MATIDSSYDNPCILSFSQIESSASTKNVPAMPCFAAFCKSFENTMGWTLGFEESRQSRQRRRQPGLGDSPVTGTLYIDDMSRSLRDGGPTKNRAKCDQFVEHIDELIGELQRTKLRLYSAHAQLSAQIPIDRSNGESYSLVELLASLLTTAADTVGLKRAAMYLLDDEAEWLTMRSSIGMKGKHIHDSERLLATSFADVEAMSGHAIVVADPKQAEIWNPPEACQSAVCIPISSPTTILGTLWIFGETAREFSDREINVLEIVAGRIAAELEREALVALNAELRQSATDQTTRIESHPVIDPPFEGWQFEGRCGQFDQKFVDWDVTDNEEIRMTVGTIGANQDRNSASLFVDPLTTNFQAHGVVKGVSFWLLDKDAGVVFDIDEWAKPLQLGKNQAIVATTTDDPKIAKKLVGDFNNGLEVQEIILCLSRI